MRKLLYILLFAPLFVFGQGKIKEDQIDTTSTGFLPKSNLYPLGDIRYAPLSAVTPAVVTPMIDGLSNVQAAYGIVRLKTGATKCVRLRRSSDNALQDFYFNSGGTLDVPVILNWLAGATGYVATWYDQSGNGNDATQATAGSQPFIVFEDVPKIRYQFSGSNVGQALTFTLGSAISANNASVFAAYKAMVGSAASSFNPGSGGYVSQKYLWGGASTNFEMYANAPSPDYDALFISSNAAPQSTVNLYEYASPNYVSIQSGSSAAKVTSNYKTASLSTLGAHNETTFTIGNSAAGLTPFGGDFYNFILFNTNVSDATISGLAGLSKTAFNLVDNTVSSLNVGFEGDSQTQGVTATNNQNYPAQMKSLLRNYSFDVGILGNFIADITTKAVHVDRNIVAGKTNVLFVWIGTNDIAGGTTGATEYASLKTYCDARTTAGWNKIYVLTMIQGSAPGTTETQRLAYNTLIRGNGNVDWTGVVDIGADTRFAYYSGTGGIYTYNTMYQTDGIHPTNAGYAIVSSYADAVIEQLSNNATVNSLTTRLTNIENNYANLSNLFTPNTAAFTLGVPNIAVQGNSYLPTIIGSTKPNGTVTIQGTTAAGSGNQGQTVIEPALGRVGIGATGFTGAFTAKSAGTYFINWLTGSSNQVIMSLNGASGALGTENLSGYQSGYTWSFDGVNTMRIYSPNFLTISAFGLNWQNSSGAVIGGYTNSGNFGFGTAASTTNPLTFSGTYAGNSATPSLFNSTVTYNPTSVNTTLVYNGYNLANTFSATGVASTTPAIVTGFNLSTTISQPAAYTYTSITGVNGLTTFNHTVGAATMTTYTGNWLQTKSTSAQNVAATTFYGARITPFNKASTGTVSGTNGYGLYLDDWSGSGLFTNQYAIYSANTSPSVLNGNLQLIPLTASQGVVTDANKNLVSQSISTISASNDLPAQTAAGTITSVTSAAANTTYDVGGYINVTAVATDVIQAQITYTDQNSTSQTISLSGISAVGNNSIGVQTIRVKASTTITLKTNLTTGIGSITFDAGGYIKKDY